MLRRLIIAGLAIAVLVLFFRYGLGQRLDFQTLLGALEAIRLRAEADPLRSGGLFFCLYVAMAALNLPGAFLLTPAAGVIFGTVIGSAWVSFASTIGATLSFLAARYLFRAFIETRFAGVAERVNRGIREEGAYYLFGLRLVPLFPFFAINPVMGLTRLPTWTFYWVSQVGMLPATVLYVNAGAQVGRIESVSGVLSPALLSSFALLAIFPFAARRLVAWFQNRRLCAQFTRPQHFDANLVVLGAGSAGLVTAYVAAAARAKVVLVEADRMGGECLNTGCVPSKALIRAGRVAALMRRAGEFGLAPNAPSTDFSQVMERVRRVIERIEPHDSVERYTALGVECVRGRARLTSPWTVAVAAAGGERTITARSIVVATGGTPALPPVPGLNDVPHVTSDSIWELAELPQRLLVLGGGPVGCELAQAFRSLGSEVTVVEMLPGLLPREDQSAGALLAEVFGEAGIRVLTGYRAAAFERRPGGGRLRCVQGHVSHGTTLDIDFDMALIAVGRTARTAGLGLEQLGITLNASGTISVNDYLQTRLPHIYACGDVAGPWQLTHVAAHQAWYCAMNALWGRFWRFRADYSVLPATVYTDPEIARVGLTEAEARAAGLAVEIVTYDLSDLDRAIADGEARGFVKVVTPRDSDRILGVTVVGAHAGETISEFVLAMRHGLGLRKILTTVHSYPTWAEANKFAAGVWQRRHLPGRLLGLAEWFNSRQL
jgi:pyruvate/2-oxoglutarate dehydrogenase complex dihydrolipoamide dehydrogenase (E3) component/uncharacterized membrane protein YdjX (TVP38/TMEM64 family)